MIYTFRTPQIVRAFAFKKEKKVSHELHQLSLIFIQFENE